MPTGIEVYNDVAAALGNRLEARLYQQFNRTSRMLSLIEAVPAINKVPAWDVEFTSGAAPAAFAEGSDVQTSELGSDKDVQATLPWARYRAPFGLSESEIKQAMRGMGSPVALERLLETRVVSRAAYLASVLNVDLFTGDGTDGAGNPTFLGLYGGGGLAATGDYAGLSRVTYPEWAANVLGNGGTPRSLTPDLMNQAEALLFSACGRNPDFIMTSVGVRRKYKGMFETALQWRTPDNQNVPGVADPQYSNIPVLRDKDATAGKLIMGVRDFLQVQYLPPLGEDDDTVQKRMRALQGNAGDPNAPITATAIPFEISPLAKNGNNVRFNLTIELQLCIKRCNAFVVIEDISEA